MRARIASITKLAGLGLLTVQGCASDVSPTQVDVDAASTSQDEDAIAAVASAPPARVASLNDDGHGRYMLAPRELDMRESMPANTSGETAARLHLSRYREQLGLSPAAIDAAILESEHSLRGGAAIYRFTQRVHDVPVFRSRATVVLDGAKNLVSLANGLVPSWVDDSASGAPALSPIAALAAAYVAAGGSEMSPTDISESAARNRDWRAYALTTPRDMLRVLDASARPVLFRDDDRLVSAYHVELITRSAHDAVNQGYGFVIAADDGRVLWRKSLTANEAFTYRVYAEPSGDHIPTDGPLLDASPHPTGVPDNYQPAFAAPSLIPMEGFNKTKDPWLDAAATYTFGNNVQAYSDRNQANSFFNSNGGFNDGSDYRAEVTSPHTFDRTYDLSKVPADSPDQIKASVTQVFYITNWMHDYYYDSGFDEKAGNAQVKNLGRGGTEGDPLLAEAQDGADNGTANNANMSTPSDGSSPRMQMYVWTGPPNRVFETRPAFTIEDWIGSASFSPATFALAATDLVLSTDGSTQVTTTGAGQTATKGTLTDACQRPTNVSGKIAVIDRGACTYVSKIQNAQAAGAVAAIVINNVSGHTAPNISASANTAMMMPILILSYEDGQKLKALLAQGPVQSTKFTRGAEVKRDGSIDSTVVAHEWGHYLHMRLQDGESAQFGGMSEGWGDFNALFMVIREGDTFAGRAYALAQYAAGGFDSRAAYYGIRRAPYSVEYTMNPFTFKHISAKAELPDSAPLSVSGDDSMNEAHAVGEIWAEMMFEVYASVLETGQTAGRPFAETKRRMADYVVAGLKAAPDDPTLVEQRDALLSVVRAMAKNDPTRADDVDAIARGFAKRGLGVHAVAPPRSSTTLNEVVESYVIDTSDGSKTTATAP